ncbi:MAG: LamG-like jellyroll fold domain-containing protein, partial [Verrucomicrobiales bacterium]
THVAWQYNPAGSGDAIVYVNGEQTARQDKNNITTPAQMVIIGGHNRDGVHSFNGAIDEVKIFDAALSAGQIQEVMEPTPFNSAPLQFTDITLDEESDTISLTFNSRAGRTYSLYYRYDLTSELLEENDSIEADPDNPTTTYDFPTPRPVPAGKVFFTLIEN